MILLLLNKNDRENIIKIWKKKVLVVIGREKKKES